MLGLLLAVTLTSATAGDGAAAPQVPKKAANFGVRQVPWMPLAVEQNEPRRPVHIGPDGLHRMPALRCSLLGTSSKRGGAGLVCSLLAAIALAVIMARLLTVAEKTPNEQRQNVYKCTYRATRSSSRRD
jgi:hypothetical protein